MGQKYVGYWIQSFRYIWCVLVVYLTDFTMWVLVVYENEYIDVKCEYNYLRKLLNLSHAHIIRLDVEFKVWETNEIVITNVWG